MNKYIKKGIRTLGTLASATICALTLSYAQTSTIEKQQKVEPYSIQKASEIYEEYVFSFITAKVDDVIKYNEFKQLYDYLEKHLPHMSIKSDKDIKKLVDYFNKNQKEKYIKQTVKDPKTQKEFCDVIVNLETKVLAYFPNLIDKGNSSITYPSNQQLDQDLNKIVKELITEADKFLKEKKDESLSRLTNREEFTIQDLLTFYSLLDQKKSLFGLKTIQKKQNLKKTSFVNILEHKKVYDAFLKDIKEWEEGKGYCIPFISAGVRPYAGTTPWDVESQPGDVSDKKMEEIFNGSKIEHVGKTVPGRTIIPPWLGLILGGFLPFVIKGFIIKYTRRRWDTGDSVETATSALCSWFTDMIHPLAMPIRLLALPIITEYLGKFVEERQWRNRR